MYPHKRRASRPAFLVLAAAFLSVLFAARPIVAAGTKPCSAYSKAQAELIAAQKDLLACLSASKGKSAGCKAKGERVIALTHGLEAGVDGVCNPEAPSPHGPVIRCSGAPTRMIVGPAPSLFSTKLGLDIDRVINWSPMFRQKIIDLGKEGYTFEYRKGEGSYLVPGDKVIVISESKKGDILATLVTLAHEVGHPGHPYVRTPPDGLTKQQFIDANVNSRLDGEGEATLMNLEIRDNLKAHGLTICIGGREKEQYENIYKQYLQDDDRAKAQRLIGEIYGTSEHPSTNKTIWYREHYEKGLSEQYDTWKAAHP